MLVLLATELIAAIAAADEPSATRSQDVDVALAGPDAVAMRELVEEKCRHLGLRAVFRLVDSVDLDTVSAPPGERRLAHVFLDFRGADRGVLFVLDGAEQRGLLRHASRRDGDEVAREELAHVLEEVLLALMSGVRIGVERHVPRPPDVPAAPARPSDDASWGFGTAIGYELTLYAPHAPPMQGVNVALLAVRTKEGASIAPGVRVDGALRLPTDLHTEPVPLSATVIALRALGTLELPLHGGFGLTGFAGVGTDLVTTVPRAAPGVVPEAPGTRATATVRAGLGVGWRGPIFVGVRLFADVDLVRADYVYASSGGSERSIPTAYVARPAMAIEIGTP